MSPLQARAELTRARILYAAAQEFELHGYAGTTTQSVAKRLNKTKGAIAYHFLTKRDLATGLLEGQLELWHRMRESARTLEIPPLDALVIITQQIGMAIVESTRGRAIFRLYHEATENVQIPSPYLNWIAVVEGLLHDAQNEGSISKDVPVDTFSFNCLAGLLGIEDICYRLGRFDRLADQIDAYWLSLLPSLGRTNGAAEFVQSCRGAESLVPPAPSILSAN